MKVKIVKYAIMAIFVLPLIVTTGCNNKDELDSVEMKVYLRPTSGEANTMKLLYTPTTAGLEKRKNSIGLPVRVNRDLAADATAYMEIDNDAAVEAYNKTHKTNFKPVPKEMYSIENEKIFLKKGETVSVDSFKIKLNDPTKLMESFEWDGFLIPMKISNIISDDKGLAISSNFGTCYVIVSLSTNIISVSDNLTGSIIDRTGWTAQASNSWGNNIASRAIDGNTNTSWASLSGDASLTIDMNGTHSIKGVQLTSNYIYNGYYEFFFTKAKIMTSADMVEWKSQGIADFELEDDGFNSYVYFYLPINCKYVRIQPMEYAMWTYGSIAEINVFK